MKRHGNHVRQEEYEIEGGERRIRVILDTIARVEELLHSVPFDRYEDLLRAVSDFLDPVVQMSDTEAKTKLHLSRRGGACFYIIKRCG